MSWSAIAGVVGGTGLFLLGMWLMTDGLKLSAGGALRAILTHGTRTVPRGIASGALITAVVQSSSAVTVAAIGFVNAGLMGLGQAVAVIYGANIGTTMTGWLVALVGFHLNIAAFALPAVGIGMLARVFGANGRLGPIGQALAGFGLFFLGIDVLRTTFLNLGDVFDLGAYAGEGVLPLLLFVGIGIVLTTLIQSSSAAMVLALTAAGGGAIPLNAAAALVIGTNIGTTSTAMLAVIDATPNARRVAAAHVIFNFIAALAALAMLPLLIAGLNWLLPWFGPGAG
ncbi:MAG: Na/Pi cotransporter family protein, partial [Pseudomonadota bacterium]